MSKKEIILFKKMNSLTPINQNTQTITNEIVHYLQKLTELLQQENKTLQTSLAANNAKNDQLQMRKSKIFADLLLDGPPTTKVYINDIITISSKWLTFIKINEQQSQQTKSIMREEYRVNSETAKFEIPTNLGIDEYTMMPFHELEILIEALTNQISENSLEMHSMFEGHQKELEHLSLQLLQMEQEIETFNSFENEIKQQNGQHFGKSM